MSESRTAKHIQAGQWINQIVPITYDLWKAVDRENWESAEHFAELIRQNLDRIKSLTDGMRTD